MREVVAALPDVKQADDLRIGIQRRLAPSIEFAEHLEWRLGEGAPQHQPILCRATTNLTDNPTHTPKDGADKPRHAIEVARPPLAPHVAEIAEL